MTHDELLKLILDSEIRSNEVGQGGWQALRAVVELHKPSTEARNTHTKNPICNNCIEEYPCTTIQAIEKEL